MYPFLFENKNICIDLLFNYYEKLSFIYNKNAKFGSFWLVHYLYGNEHDGTQAWKMPEK